MSVRAEGIGVVVIGRNEGERFLACLDSLGDLTARAVYVDSGSTDGSREAARAHGVAVVELDLSRPFTAARARNAGLAELERLLPDLRFVQFVDGDCRLAPGWIEAAAGFLAAHPQVAAVAGRRREIHPEQTVYNRLCDAEWDTPVGEALAIGGDCLMRAEPLRAAGGYAPDLIAGEEPELCVRLRAAGWTIQRIDAEMTSHDAAITRFSQWWRRMVRGGHAFAEVAARHVGSPFGIWRHEARRALAWGLVLPALIVLAAPVVHPAFGLAALVYPLQVARLALRDRGEGAWTRALFQTLAKFPEAQGALRFHLHRLSGRGRGALIEYK
ncbi:glycosyltransferase family A protein [Aureimonas sp. ME7]|uniref:glycosyltransferase n=1 Tax=Aureimonas sp. ME7 TaxID=2744252 RepID=UPI0015F71033|nr:glycosyltransferase family A protein [Aureimonas sp. ME7]